MLCLLVLCLLVLCLLVLDFLLLCFVLSGSVEFFFGLLLVFLVFLTVPFLAVFLFPVLRMAWLLLFNFLRIIFFGSSIFCLTFLLKVQRRQRRVNKVDMPAVETSRITNEEAVDREQSCNEFALGVHLTKLALSFMS